MAKEFIVKAEVLRQLLLAEEPKNPSSVSDPQSRLNQYVDDVICAHLDGGGDGDDSEFKTLKVFALGSLGLKRLCPYSDIDLMVIGPLPTVQSFAKALGQELHHLKIRHIDSAAEGFSAWFKDTRVFDHYSLVFARAYRDEDQKLLDEFLQQPQKDHIRAGKDAFLNQLLEEKSQRSQRYGNVAGMLQPNVKFGRGGLRDITQALGWLRWWGEIKNSKFHQKLEKELLNYYEKLSQLRFALHTVHPHDYITADLWSELSKSEPEAFQKEVQKIFNAVKVINEYVFKAPEFYHASQITSEFESEFDVERFLLKFKSGDLSRRDGLQIRLHLQDQALVFEDHEQTQILGAIHEKFLHPLSDDQCSFLFDSLIMAKIMPHWETIEGRPQSGHYHQYTVDQHLLKTLVSVCRLQNLQINAFRLEPMVQSLKPEHWQLLKWVSLFHDLAKGLPGDHSELGAEIVLGMECSQWSEKFKTEISEMVRLHLVLSKSAFRYDHNDAENLQQLYTELKSFRFFKMLTVFTAADIMASNPEAWNEWKADQFFLLSESFRAFVNNGQVSSLVEMHGFQILVTLVNKLGEALLRQDISSLSQSPTKLEFKVLTHEHNIWIRAYAKDSGPGVLVKMLNVFFQAGLSIEQAFICGNELQKVAYNWFRLPLKTSKTTLEIERTLKVLDADVLKVTDVQIRFEDIKCLSDVDSKWVFLFKGLDQKGLLLKVAQVFSQMQLNILKAQVSTWGLSVEDVFVVEQRPDLDIKEVLDFLRREFVDNYWH